MVAAVDELVDAVLGDCMIQTDLTLQDIAQSSAGVALKAGDLILRIAMIEAELANYSMRLFKKVRIRTTIGDSCECIFSALTRGHDDFIALGLMQSTRQ